MHISPDSLSANTVKPKIFCKMNRCTMSALTFAAIFAGTHALSAQRHTTAHEAHVRYQVIDLGPLAAIADEVSPSINDSGIISTWMPTPDGTIHAFAGMPGQFKDLGTLPGDNSSIGRALNNQGQVVGWSVAGKNLVDSLVATHAFLADHGQLVPLGNFGGRDSQAMALNNHGAVVGVASLPSKDKHAFLYSGGKLQDLGVLPGGTYSAASSVNDAGMIAGTAETKEHFLHAVIWKNQKLIDLGTLIDGKRSQAEAINNHGTVVGFSEADVGDVHAFIYRNGRMQDLGELAESPVRANSVNDKDRVVGLAAISEFVVHAFLWQDGVLLDLNRLLAPDPKWEVVNAYSINNRGQILVSGSSTGKDKTSHLLLLNPMEGSPPQ
jgi:probable HAF family extracellular repeat protein